MRNLENRGSFPSRYDIDDAIYCAYESTYEERVPRYPTPAGVLADEFLVRLRGNSRISQWRCSACWISRSPLCAVALP